jgi:hypothetical protein
MATGPPGFGALEPDVDPAPLVGRSVPTGESKGGAVIADDWVAVATPVETDVAPDVEAVVVEAGKAVAGAVELDAIDVLAADCGAARLIEGEANIIGVLAIPLVLVTVGLVATLLVPPPLTAAPARRSARRRARAPSRAAVAPLSPA